MAADGSVSPRAVGIRALQERFSFLKIPGSGALPVDVQLDSTPATVVSILKPQVALSRIVQWSTVTTLYRAASTILDSCANLSYPLHKVLTWNVRHISTMNTLQPIRTMTLHRASIQSTLGPLYSIIFQEHGSTTWRSKTISGFRIRTSNTHNLIRIQPVLQQSRLQ